MGIEPVIFDIITGSHEIRGLFECSGFSVQYEIPFASHTGVCDNPTTVFLQCRRGKPNLVTHAFVMTDICDPESINSRTGVQNPELLRIWRTAVPRTTVLEV